MTDYGHDPIFGVFITPTARQPRQAVALAQLAERVGLDLVTFQDHPYQPALLDTWTLLSYIAAATDRVRLAGNVLNLPLRQPVVLARSAASLDLLTGGRVELGIGAGAFWDAIEAAGGRRLTPGESVAALEEAIRVIREVWAADQRGGVRVHGEHYRVVGAKRGPAPAHDIGIWVGGYKPRMLRLIGRLADGWLPSLSYLPDGPASLDELNAYIDEGAAAAGRDPRAVRRLLNISGDFTEVGSGLLNGPPEQWAEDLAAIAGDHGISGFILVTDDPAGIEAFGEEVAPAVRELVPPRGPAVPRPPRGPAVPRPPRWSPVTPEPGRPPGSRRRRPSGTAAGRCGTSPTARPRRPPRPARSTPTGHGPSVSTWWTYTTTCAPSCPGCGSCSSRSSGARCPPARRGRS